MRAPSVLVLGGSGYIGSVLVARLHASMRVAVADPRPYPGRLSLANSHKCFQELSATELAQFDAIVLLAGHSSVGACDDSPRQAFDNNVNGFVELVHRLRGQKLLFASSISVYVAAADHPLAETAPPPEAACYYDLHKQTIERYAALAYPNQYALRFGTVCGPSPAIRSELLLNSLVRSAITEKQVRIANPHVHRPLLGINDLCRAVETILTQEIPPGVYNLASTNVRLGALGHYVAERYRVPCVEVKQPTSYDVQVDTSKFREAADFEFTDTIPSLVDELEAFYTQQPANQLIQGAAA